MRARLGHGPHDERARLIGESVLRHTSARPFDAQAGREKPVRGQRPGGAARVHQVVVRPRIPERPRRRRRHPVDARHERHLERLLDAIDADAHLVGQRPARHVVRALGRGRAAQPPRGVLLHFEQALGVGAERLRHHDERRADGVDGVADLEGLRHLLHLDAAVREQVDQRVRGRGVVLVRRDGERVGALRRAALDRAAAHRVEVQQQLFLVARRGPQQAPHGGQVVVDDVAQAPGAAGPRIGEVDLRRVLREAPGCAAQVLRRHLDRVREPRRRRFRQQAHRVPAERRGVLVARPVVVVHRVRDDAGLALALELEGHRAAQQRGLPPDQRVLVRVDGVVVRRHEEPRAVAAHLVHREEHLRVPLAREEPRERAVLGHVQHEGVAVDVVADVLVVRPRHLAARRTACPASSCASP